MDFPENPTIIDTTLKYVENKYPFYLNVANQLLQKQKQSKTEQQASSKTFDALGTIPAEQTIKSYINHNIRLVFNKFNICKQHYLLISLNFRSQHEILNRNYFNVISGLIRQNSNFCYFYNGGLASGSSQPRQHVQMTQFPYQMPLEILISQIQIDQRKMIYELDVFRGKRHGVVFFDKTLSSTILQKAYKALLRKTNVKLVEIGRNQIPGNYFAQLTNFKNAIDKKQKTIVSLDSYSLLFNDKFMFMAKRKAENGFNSASFSGFGFVKTEEDAKIIEKNGLFQTLRDCIEDIT